MQLAKLQQAFGNTLLNKNDAPIVSAITSDAISPAAHLAIYRNNVQSNITDALADTYAAIYKLVGPDFFGAMARVFIASHPPTSGDLNLYGAGFDTFIANYTPAASLPYLADIATYEWAWNNAFFAPDDAPLMPATLTELTAEEQAAIVLIPRVSLQLLSLHYPADTIWLFCEKGEGKGDIPSTDKGTYYILLWRHASDVHSARISAAEHAMWKEIMAKTPFHDAVNTVLETYQEFDLQSFIQNMFAQGTCTRLQ